MFITTFATYLKTNYNMEQKHYYQQQSFRFRKFVGKGYAAFNSLHKTITIGVISGCVLTAVTLPPVHAQEVALEDSLRQTSTRELELDEITVTAVRPETPLSQRAKLVTVITGAQIEQAPVQSLQDVLLHSPHIDVVQRGGRGVQADISIRGGTAEQNVILLNGINLSNAHTGHYNLDLPLNLSDIERIEIIHGPSALIYGAGSFTGGINIITKKEPVPRLYARVETGAHNLAGAELRGAITTGAASHSLSASREASSGYIANSDYRIYNVLWQTRLKLAGNSTIDAQAGYNGKSYGANTFYSALYPQQYEQTYTLAGSVKAETGGKVKLIPALYWSRHGDIFELTRGSDAGRNRHRNDAYGLNFIAAYVSAYGQTRLGLDIRHESILSNVLGEEMEKPRGQYLKADARTNTGISIEHTLTLNRWMASAGVLLSHTTLIRKAIRAYPSINIAYYPGSFKLTASWSRSTRMPSFTDLYYTTLTHQGDSRLRPERSESFDLGIRQVSALADIHLNAFLLRGKDMIDWVKTSSTDSRWSSWNLTEVHTLGIETGIDLRPALLLPGAGAETVLRIGYTRMSQSSDAHGLISAYTLNYLRDKLTAHLAHSLPCRLSADWRFRLQKRMGTYETFKDGRKTGDAPYPGFSVLDLRLTYLRGSLKLYLNLNNVYNTRYFDRGNIPQARFWPTAGLVYTIR
jgi:iron complex outermembrane receptor protein